MRLPGQLVRVGGGFATQQLVGRLRIGAIGRDQDGHETGALDVLQELEAQALSGVRALDDARNVGDHEAAMIGQRHDAQIRLEGGERIVGDLGTRGGDDRQERALPRVGLAQQADVGDQLEHQLDRPLFPVGSRLPLARRLMGRRGELGVAPPAASALGHEQRLARLQELAQSFATLGNAYLGAWGNRQEQIVPRASGHLLPLPMDAALGLPFGVVAVVEQRREVGVDPHEDTAARAAVAAVGAALGDVLLASERDAAVAAVAGFDVDVGFIDEHGTVET